MGVLKRVQRTKTQKGKRALEEREPKAVENTKTALFVRGTNCSDKVMKCMKGLLENSFVTKDFEPVSHFRSVQFEEAPLHQLQPEE